MGLTLREIRVQPGRSLVYPYGVLHRTYHFIIYHLSLTSHLTIDGYSEDGKQEEAYHLRSYYHDPLQRQPL